MIFELCMNIAASIVGIGSVVLLVMALIWAGFTLIKKIRQAEREAFPEED